jgi:SAM-dependent methyltransferase
MNSMESLLRHNDEIQLNREIWKRKEVLRKVYGSFYNLFKKHLRNSEEGQHLELGSGSGQIKEFLPNCMTSDLFENPWVDRKESAYKLSFPDAALDNVVMMDVFHHLRYPGLSLEEFWRVLKPGGRILIIDPYISALGAVVYGVFHKEPVDFFGPIEWKPKARSFTLDYYAAQGNLSRIFFTERKWREKLQGWTIVRRQRFSFFTYIASGGFTGRQLYPAWAYKPLRLLDRILDLVPWLFATRALVVLEKKA